MALRSMDGAEDFASEAVYKYKQRLKKEILGIRTLHTWLIIEDILGIIDEVD